MRTYIALFEAIPALMESWESQDSNEAGLVSNGAIYVLVVATL